jgi:hypothetical protein
MKGSMTTKRTAARAVTLKVTLDQVDPPIWRRLAVRRDCPLGELHDIIQAVMGWENYHLHEFRLDNSRYGPVDPSWDMDPRILDELCFQLDDLLDEGAPVFRYLYDFGDGWNHTVQVESECDAAEFDRLPVCIDGERSCPPEDCGGVWGYDELLEALADPNHERHEELSGWIDPDFDPEKFDLSAANRELRRGPNRE